jgi:glycosyltransferase involved in cell wall biosynthesis
VRILYVTMQYGQGYGQGTERYLTDLGREMKRRGHEIVYLAGDPLERGPRRSLGDVVQRDPLVIACPTFGLRTVRGASPQQLIRVLHQHRPDIVHLANPAHIGAGITEACRQIHIPYVVTTMDFWWTCPKSTRLHYKGGICPGNQPWVECTYCSVSHETRVAMRELVVGPSGLLALAIMTRSMIRGAPITESRRWFVREHHMRLALQHAAHVIFPSSATHANISPLLGHDRWSTIPYGLEAHWFAPREPRPRRDPPTIGFAGTLAPHKGAHLLLDAFHLLGWKDVPLRIAGPHGHDEYMERLDTKAEKLFVEIVGEIAPSRMPAFLRELDLLVVPSTWPENAPFIVLEAHACGTPVMVSDVDGMAELVPEEEFRFPPNSANMLAQTLARWRAHPTEQTRPHVPRVEEMADATHAIYTRAKRAGGS